MLEIDESTTPLKKKKGGIPSYPKCTLLAWLGVDYLGQFSNHYQIKIDFTFNGDKERAENVLVEVIEKVLVDPKRTDSILSSIAFYILSIKDQSNNLQVSTTNILAQLLEATKLPLNLQWVWFNNIKYSILLTFENREMKTLQKTC